METTKVTILKKNSSADRIFNGEIEWENICNKVNYLEDNSRFIFWDIWDDPDLRFLNDSHPWKNENLDENI